MTSDAGMEGERPEITRVNARIPPAEAAIATISYGEDGVRPLGSGSLGRISMSRLPIVRPTVVRVKMPSVAAGVNRRRVVPVESELGAGA